VTRPRRGRASRTTVRTAVAEPTLTARLAPLRAYARESRDIGLSLLLVLPLLLAYEIVMLLVQSPVRNGAEMVVSRFLAQLSPDGLVTLRRGLVLLLMVVALVLVRAAPPKVARARWVLAEALLCALLLGPLVSLLVGGIGLSVRGGELAGAAPAWQPFLLSIGAGLWEELVFRLALLGGLAYLLVRVTALPRRAAFGVAIAVSALAFAFYHHLGSMGEPLAADRFLFRTFAGTILGLLFAVRGLAVVVYMHVFYDVLCDLRALNA
jgi:membrane protease YdiL (CAAX protease family)